VGDEERSLLRWQAAKAALELVPVGNRQDIVFDHGLLGITHGQFDDPSE
jgi:hypothetical protein